MAEFIVSFLHTLRMVEIIGHQSEVSQCGKLTQESQAQRRPMKTLAFIAAGVNKVISCGGDTSRVFAAENGGECRVALPPWKYCRRNR